MTVSQADLVRVRVPAKVNLYLEVGERRPDGYHELTTVFMAVSLYDEVTVTPASRFSAVITGDQAEGVPLGADNLAIKAAHRLARHARISDRVRISIAKSIPVAAGMAGGSADAAATLVALNELWNTDLSRAELEQLGAMVGADVPFLIGGGMTLGTGRGDLLAPILARGTYHFVFAIADYGLSTPDVFAQFDRMSADSGPSKAAKSSRDVLAAIASGDAKALGLAMRNDLTEAAVSLCPELGEMLKTGHSASSLGALGATICGSGPTVAILAADAENAHHIATVLSERRTITRTIVRAQGPVPGARVV